MFFYGGYAMNPWSFHLMFMTDYRVFISKPRKWFKTADRPVLMFLDYCFSISCSLSVGFNVK